MNMKLSFILIVAFYASNAFAEISGARSCPGGYAHGTQVDVERYWYECRDGQLVPKGCISNGNHVDVGATFDTSDYRMKCILGSDGFLTVKYHGCMSGGSGRDIGSQWDDGTAFYTCVQDGSNVRVVTLGCVDQGRPLKLDERVAKGDFLYQCNKATDGTPTLHIVGCVYEGRKHIIGEQYEGPKFLYTCTDKGSKIVGCMFESRRYLEADQVTKGDFKYACKVNDEQTDFIPLGCIQRDDSGASIDRKIGCFWTEGEYEYTCKDLGNGQMAKEQTQCIYKSAQGIAKIRPGCARLADGTTVNCVDLGSGKLRIETHGADQLSQFTQC
jgi:hypothetical protein